MHTNSSYQFVHVGYQHTALIMFKPFSRLYFSDDEDTTDAETEPAVQTPHAVDADELKISNSVFNELCPTKEPSQKVRIQTCA